MARVYRTSFANVPAADVWGTGRYAYDIGPELDDRESAWEFDGADEVDAYGFTSFTCLTKEPMDRRWLIVLSDDWPDGVLRSKGNVRFADAPPVMISVVRDSMDLLVVDDPGSDVEADAGWDETQVACIGRGRDVQAMVDRLDACITDP